MPLYKYKCSNCDCEFEKLMKISDKNNDRTHISCPQCGCSENIPMINRTSFSLKGGRWYKDGYS